MHLDPVDPDIAGADHRRPQDAKGKVDQDALMAGQRLVHRKSCDFMPNKSPQSTPSSYGGR